MKNINENYLRIFNTFIQIYQEQSDECKIIIIYFHGVYAFQLMLILEIPY